MQVGVLIGKAGETIRNLQTSSGAKIQITKDIDADSSALTRSVELVGTLAVEKDLDQPCVVLMLCVVYIHVYKRPVD